MIVKYLLPRKYATALEEELEGVLSYLPESDREGYKEWFWGVIPILRADALEDLRDMRNQSYSLDTFLKIAKKKAIYYALLFVIYAVIIAFFIAYLVLFWNPATRMISGICLLISSTLGFFTSTFFCAVDVVEDIL